MHGMVTDADDARRRSLPFLLVEYAHAMGNGPGSLQDYQRIIERARPAVRRLRLGVDRPRLPRARRPTAPRIVHARRRRRLRAERRALQPRRARLQRSHPHPGARRAREGVRAATRSTSATPFEIRNMRHVAGHRRSGLPLAGRGRRATRSRRGVLDVPVAGGWRGGRCAAGSTVGRHRAAAGEVVLTVEAVLAADERLGARRPRRRVGPAGPRRGRARASRARVRATGGAPRGVRSARVGPRCSTRTTGRLCGSAISSSTARGSTCTARRPRTTTARARSTTSLACGGDRHSIACCTAPTPSQRRPDGSSCAAAPRRDPSARRATGRCSGRADGDGLLLDDRRSTSPGPGPTPRTCTATSCVPRLGLLFALPALSCEVDWFGRGPGRDLRRLVRGLAHRPLRRVDRRPADALSRAAGERQPCGTRAGWSCGDGDVGAARRRDARLFDFTARRWTSHRPRRRRKAARAARLRTGVAEHRSRVSRGSARRQSGPALPEQYRIPRADDTWSIRLWAAP